MRNVSIFIIVILLFGLAMGQSPEELMDLSPADRAAFEAVEPEPVFFQKVSVESSPYTSPVLNSSIDALFDLQFSFNLEIVTGALGNAGAEFDGTYYYSTRWASNLLHKMDMSGNLVEEFSIAGVTGLRDLAFDGTYMYGGAAGNTIYQMDFVSKTLIGTIPSPVAVRHIAYDESVDGFWVGNWADPPTLINRSGTTIGTLTTGLAGQYGTAYDNYSDGGPYLWVFDQGSGGGLPQLIHQFNIASGTATGVTHDVLLELGPNASGIAGGLWVSEGIVPGFASIGGVLQGTPDVYFVYELAPTSDPDDPEPPTNVTAYSDYSTPTSMALSWTDPTALVNGTTISPTDFTIEIERDGTPLTSVAGGVENYTDTGLTDGQSYDYTLFAKLIANDSTSSMVMVSWIAGGAGQPMPPTNFSIVNAGGGQLRARWTNPAENIDGTPMDDFAGINIYESGALLTTFTRTSADTGRADSALFTPTNVNLEYYLTAVDNETPANESAGSNTAFPPFSAPYLEDFEGAVVGTPGTLPILWTNETDDDFDWYVDAGGTPSASTGPSVDHTLGTSAGKYMFTESSSPNYPAQIAHLTTPFIDMSGVNQPGLSFWYHMYGATMGELHVDVFSGGVWVLDVMSPLIGQQQAAQTDPWLQALVDLSVYAGSPVKVRFRGITGTSFTSDMAIDDVYFTTLAGDPTMVVSTTAIGDTLLVGATSSKMFTISNTTAAPSILSYTITENPAVTWLSVTPNAGSLTSLNSEDIQVDFDATAVSAGTFTTQLVINGNDPVTPQVIVDVTLQANEAPVIAISPDTFDVSVTSGQTLLDTLNISNSGNGPLYYRVESVLPLDGFMSANHAKVNESALAPGVRVAMEQRASITGIANSMEETVPGTFSGFRPPDVIEAEEIFGSTASPFTGTLRDRGNVFQVTTATTLLEHRLYLDIPTSTPIYFFVYQGTNWNGQFTKVNEVFFANSGTGQGFYSSGPIGVPLEVGSFYYIGASWQGSATYYRGTETTPIPCSFGFLETGIPGNIAGGYPPAATANNTYTTRYSPYYCAIVTGAGVDWLTAVPDTGMVAAGGNVDVELTFDPAGLLGGDYYARLRVNSNDPVTPEVFSGVHMFVIAEPNIIIAPDSILFPNLTVIGATDTLPFTVYNTGAGVLNVTGISSSNATFTVSQSVFDIPPFDSTVVDVIFTPTAAQVETGLLTISSNDPDTPTFDVYVEAEGIDAPVIGVAPDTLDVIVKSDTTATEVVTISNTGAGPLVWDLTIEGVFDNARNIDIISNGPSANTRIISRGRSIPVAYFLNRKTTSQNTVSMATYEPVDEALSFIRNNAGLLPIENGRGEEVFGGTQFSYGPSGARGRGNHFYCSTATTLLEHRLYLNMTANSDMQFLVYEGDVQIGNYNLINVAEIANSGTGEGWYSSGAINVPLVAGKYYMIYPQWTQPANYYNNQTITPYPIPTSFGELQMGVGFNYAPSYSVPAAATQNVPSTAFGAATAYYQTIVTGAGVDWLTADTANGIIPPGGSTDVTFTFNPSGLLGGDYYAVVNINSNDPILPMVDVGVHMFVDAEPDISTNPDSLYFANDLFVGASETKTLWIVNDAPGVLNVTDITSSDPVFTVDTTNFQVAAFDSFSVEVTFEPTSAATFSTVLQI
ncbi:MAG: choice-of-anchor D domain-containing protein, partial [bacterium]